MEEAGRRGNCWYLILYSAGRFILEFWRGDAIRGAVGPLSTSQFIGIFTFLAGIILLALRRKSSPAPETDAEEKPTETGETEAAEESARQNRRDGSRGRAGRNGRSRDRESGGHESAGAEESGTEKAAEAAEPEEPKKTQIWKLQNRIRTRRKNGVAQAHARFSSGSQSDIRVEKLTDRN